MGAQDLTGRSAATIHCSAIKGRTRNAHFLWQPRCSCFLTPCALSNVHWSPCCFQRCDRSLVFILFLTFFLPSVPSCWSIYTSYFRSLFLSRFFFVGLFFWSDSFLTFLLIQWICVFPSHPSFYRLYPFVLFLLCILSSFSVRHKNNRLFPHRCFLSFRLHSPHPAMKLNGRLAHSPSCKKNSGYQNVTSKLFWLRYILPVTVPAQNSWTPKRKAKAAREADPRDTLNKLWGSPQASEVSDVRYIGLSLPFTSSCLSPMRTLRVSL